MRNAYVPLLCLMLLALLPTTGSSQDKKNPVLGRWTITAVYDQYENGDKKDNWGGGVAGEILFTDDGHFSQMIIGKADAASKSPDPRKPDAPIVAYYGSYRIDGSGNK